MAEGRRRAGTVGILGGGQLGRMLCVAASRLGIETIVLAPEPDPVAGHVATRLIRAGYDDASALAQLADAADVVTFEFENVPVAALDGITERGGTVRPGREALAVTQDRLAEKDFVTGLGLGTAPYAALGEEQDIDAALELVGLPAVIKTRRFGYDGKGQHVVTSAEEAAEAWRSLGSVPCIAEGFIDFEREISVVAARGPDGRVVCYEPGENEHRDGILRTTTVPSRAPSAVREEARALAPVILGALAHVGVMGIELFATRDGRVLVNELAPRVHNSGHWTQDGCVIDQFEQHIRAIMGWPLGDGSRHSDVVMTNLIGDDVDRVGELAGQPDVALHVYGKSEVRAGRKMGHANRVLGAVADPARGAH